MMRMKCYKCTQLLTNEWNSRYQSNKSALFCVSFFFLFVLFFHILFRFLLRMWPYFFPVGSDLLIIHSRAYTKARDFNRVAHTYFQFGHLWNGKNGKLHVKSLLAQSIWIHAYQRGSVLDKMNTMVIIIITKCVFCSFSLHPNMIYGSMNQIIPCDLLTNHLSDFFSSSFWLCLEFRGYFFAYSLPLSMFFHQWVFYTRDQKQLILVLWCAKMRTHKCLFFHTI